MSKSKNNTISIKREPLLRIVKRDDASIIYRLFVRAVTVGFAFLLIMLIIQGVTKYDFTQIWNYLKIGAFGSKFSKNETIKDTLMLLAIAIGLSPAFKMRFWNIGAQGQVLFGALLSAIVVKYLGAGMNNSVLLLLMFVVAVIGGGLWAFIPGIFKVKLNANETLFTLMMNYIAIKLVACFMDLWKGQASALAPFKTGFLPSVFNNSYGMIYLLVAILTVVMFIYLKSTKHGYEISVVGESINTARYAGINTNKVILRTVFLSGAICGFCGFLYAGNVHSIATTMGGNYGFTAIIVAWVAKFNPFIMVPIAFSIVFLEAGSKGIVDNSENLNSYISYIIVGVFLFLIIGCEFFVNYKLKFNSKITAFYNKIADKLESKMPNTFALCQRIAFAIANFYKKIDKAIKSFIARVNALTIRIVAIIVAAISGFFAKIIDCIKSKISPKATCIECEKPQDKKDIGRDEEVNND